MEVPEDGGSYSSGLWTVDNRNDPNGLSPDSQPADLDMTIGMREKSTTSVVEVSPDDRSLDLRVSIDLSDESNAFVEVIAGIYQIQSSSLASWGVPDLMPKDKDQHTFCIFLHILSIPSIFEYLSHLLLTRRQFFHNDL